MKKLLGIAFFAGSLLLTSCHTTKYSSTISYNGGAVEQTRFEKLVKSSFKYEALQSKVKYSMGKTGMGGKMCVESGKRVCLQVNAPLLGFEVARIEATGEEILIVDKFDKLYTRLNFTDLYDIQELKGHELEALEALMLGRIFIPGKGQATTKDYDRLTWNTLSNADGTTGNSTGTYTGQGYTLVYTLDGMGMLISTQLTVGAKSALWEYSNFSDVESGKCVPTVESIRLNDGNQVISATLTINNPQLGESNWRDFEPSGSYRQVGMSDLIEAVKAVAK